MTRYISDIEELRVHGIGDWRTPYRAEVARRRAVLGREDRLTELDGRPRTTAEEIEWRRLV